MKIIQLTADNFKRLKAVEIKPDGSLVVITGKNAQGKSSVLDAIWAALGGRKAAPPKPVREGEKHAIVTLNLGDYTVSRSFAEDKTWLTVKSADGANISNPQKLLDSLIASISFDPLEFSRMQPKMQSWQLAQVAEIDFTELNDNRQDLYEKRSDINRDKKRLEGEIAGMKQRDSDIEGKRLKEEISVEKVMEEYEAAKRKQSTVEGMKRDVVATEQMIDDKKDKIKTLHDEIKVLTAEVAALKSDCAQTAAEAEQLEKTVPDLEAIKAKTKEAESIRDHNEAVKLYTLTEQARFEQEKLTQEITEQLAAIDQEKKDLVAAAKLPLEGLTFDEDGVFFNGVPFEQCSSSEQLRVSTALAINLNPKLRVIRINDGSLLDKDNLAALESIATDNDFQIWIERVGEGDIGILIEDGQIKTQETEA